MTSTSDIRRQGGPESRRSPLASGSISEHLLRGAAGLIAAVLAIALLARVGPVSLALLPLTVLAWRGCPTCWTVGLFGTLADGRASRTYCTAERGCRPCRPRASFQIED